MASEDPVQLRVSVHSMFFDTFAVAICSIDDDFNGNSC